ncbi:MAG: hypothetical protein LBT47_09275 [Deltaproteobacteria bacterium]|jgi:hypothetical protein|nr:hypothetical protein [Deltaproteobacteria bacterium]
MIFYPDNHDFSRWQRHYVMGQVGTIHVVSWRPGGVCKSPKVLLTLLQNPTAASSERIFHQVILEGDQAVGCLEQGVKSGDVVLMSLADPVPKAYLQSGSETVRAVPYLESLGLEISLIRPAETFLADEPHSTGQNFGLREPHWLQGRPEAADEATDVASDEATDVASYEAADVAAEEFTDTAAEIYDHPPILGQSLARAWEPCLAPVMTKKAWSALEAGSGGEAELASRTHLNRPHSKTGSARKKTANALGQVSPGWSGPIEDSDTDKAQESPGRKIPVSAVTGAVKQNRFRKSRASSPVLSDHNPADKSSATESAAVAKAEQSGNPSPQKISRRKL